MARNPAIISALCAGILALVLAHSFAQTPIPGAPLPFQPAPWQPAPGTGGGGGVQVPQFPSNYTNGSGAALAPSGTGNLFLQLPSGVPSSVYCRTIATVRVTNDSGTNPAKVTWIIGVSNPVPGVLGSNCPQFPYLGVSHPTTVDTLNLAAGQSGSVTTFRDDFINTDNFCGQLPVGPPFNLTLGTNGTTFPQLNPQLTNASGAGVNVDWNANATYQCIPANTCNTHNCQPVF